MIIESEETKYMRLVCQGKYKINQLGYNKKTHEYVYFHKGKEIWRMKGDESLLNYFDDVRARDTYTEQSVLNQFPIYLRYSDSCHKFELEEFKEWYK